MTNIFVKTKVWNVDVVWAVHSMALNFLTLDLITVPWILERLDF